jgi:tRNA(Ile2) C34 agmatinyltransferase TiaS
LSHFETDRKADENGRMVEEKIAVNGTMAYKTSQKISIANLGNAPVCPSCSNMMIFAEGCMKCEACGYSKCG